MIGGFIGYNPMALVGYNSLEDPNEAITRNNIGLAKAYSRRENGLTQGLDFAGGLMQYAGNALMSSGLNGLDGKIAKATELGSLSKAKKLTGLRDGFGIVNNIGGILGGFSGIGGMF